MIDMGEVKFKIKAKNIPSLMKLLEHAQESGKEQAIQLGLDPSEREFMITLPISCHPDYKEIPFEVVSLPSEPR